MKFVIAALLLCASALAGPTQLDFWHSMSGGKAKLLTKLTQRFNESQKEIFVHIQFVGNYEEGLNKLRTALLAKRGPHIMQITDIGTGLLADSGKIRPIADFIDKDPTFPLDLLLPPVRRYYEIRGRLNSLPFATSNPIVYYNIALFEKHGVKPPKTFDELVTVARALTDKKSGRTGITWPLHSWFFEQFIARQGKNFVNFDNGRSGRPTEANFLIPEAIRFVTLWDSMVREGIFANVGTGWEPAEQNFVSSRSAMLITSTSNVFELIHKTPFKIGTAAIPTFDPKVPGGTPIGGNSLWIINSKPENEQEAAYQFLKFMASKATQREWHMGTGYFPIRQDVIDELEKEGFYKKMPAARTAIDQLMSAAPTSASQGALLGVFPEVRQYVDSAIEQILAGYADIPTALTRAKHYCEEAMARYNRRRK